MAAHLDCDRRLNNWTVATVVCFFAFSIKQMTVFQFPEKIVPQQFTVISILTSEGVKHSVRVTWATLGLLQVNGTNPDVTVLAELHWGGEGVGGRSLVLWQKQLRVQFSRRLGGTVDSPNVNTSAPPPCLFTTWKSGGHEWQLEPSQRSAFRASFLSCRAWWEEWEWGGGLRVVLLVLSLLCKWQSEVRHYLLLLNWPF